jgi:hypothetical protein
VWVVVDAGACYRVLASLSTWEEQGAQDVVS